MSVCKGFYAAMILLDWHIVYRLRVVQVSRIRYFIVDGESTSDRVTGTHIK